MFRKGMLARYILRRALSAIPLLFFVIILTFLIIHLAPGSPVTIFIGDYAASPEYIAMITKKMGLDRPIYEQLVIYIINVLRGDLGTSYFTNEPVSQLILERIGNTLLLLVLGLGWSSLAGVLMGALAATKPYSKVDNFISVISVAGYSMPYFWLGMLVIEFFSLYLGVLPMGGLQQIGIQLGTMGYIVDRLTHLILPTFTLGIFNLALVSRLQRSSLLEVLGLDYITMAWSKGLSKRAVVLRHGLRNALLPVVTVIGLNVGASFGGAVLTEIVFTYPGIGLVAYDALVQRDYPVILGVLLVVSFVVIVANLLVDILYAVLDPRVRYE